MLHKNFLATSSLILAAIIALTSCDGLRYDIPQEIIDFTNKFPHVRECVSKYRKASLVYNAVHTINDEVAGTQDDTYVFSMETDGEYSSHHVTLFSGTLGSDDFPNLKKFETILTPLGDKKYDYITYHDGVIMEATTYRDVDQSKAYETIYPFFANPGGVPGTNGNVNGGGMFYGDKILMDCNTPKVQDMLVDPETNTFKYEFSDYPIQGKIASMKYIVNQDGMLLEWHQTIKSKDNQLLKADMYVTY